MEIVKSICFECHARCGVLLQVKDNRLVGIKGDKEHPFSKGFTCPKARACMEIIYHPDRITKPLLRVGKRGEGKWEDISWDRALSVISERLLEIRETWGAESLVIGQGTTRCASNSIMRFLGLYGSPNFHSPIHMSGGPVFHGSLATCGYSFAGSADFANSQCIILWASNPEQAWAGLFMTGIKQGLAAGAKLIVIDPRGIPLAKKADHWLQVRPQTDLALALGFLRVIINNELYDKEFVEQWTVGFEELKAHVQPFTLEKCTEITGVPAEEVETAAFTLAKTRPMCINPGMAGACQMTNAMDLNRALTIISAITGNLEIPGGNLRYVPPTGKRSCYSYDLDPMNTLPEVQKKKRLSRYSRPIWEHSSYPSELTWRAILDEAPYPVKALGLFASNPMCAFANSQNIKKALEKVDFLFTADYFHTPTTALSDVILPAAHWTERDDLEDLIMRNHVFCQLKAVDAPSECRDERQVLIDLARVMKLDEPWESTEQLLDFRLEPIGTTFKELKKIGYYKTPVKYKSYETRGRFSTASGKVELSIPRLKDIGGHALPTYIEPFESPISQPELASEYPLMLITGARNIAFYHSALRNIPSLRKHAPDPELSINPNTARELCVEEGEWVWLATLRGRVEIKVKYDAGMSQNVVHAPHGYWYGVENGWGRLNINILTDHRPICTVTGSVPTRSMLCKVEKMETRVI